MSRVRLVAFDLDGTLVRGPTVVEALCRVAGREEVGSAAEQLEMRDEEGVAAAREEMAVWCRTLSERELSSAFAALELAPDAHEGVALLRERGVATAIVSITWEFAVAHVARSLEIDHFVGTRLRDGSVEHFWPRRKGEWVDGLAARLGARRHEVAAVGDSAGDVELLTAAGIRYFVGQHVPSGIDNVRHRPEGSILEIAREIVGV